MTTPRQRRFVREFVRDYNATRAAIRAGYSARSAREYGSALARRPDLRALIDASAGQGDNRILLDAERLIGELMAIAFSDIRNYVVRREDGTLGLKPLDQLTMAETAAIANFAPGNGRRGPILRLRPKKAALAALARHVGLRERRHSVDPAILVAETARIREKVLRAAGIDPMDVMPPPEED